MNRIIKLGIILFELFIVKMPSKGNQQSQKGSSQTKGNKSTDETPTNSNKHHSNINDSNKNRGSSRNNNNNHKDTSTLISKDAETLKRLQQEVHRLTRKLNSSEVENRSLKEGIQRMRKSTTDILCEAKYMECLKFGDALQLNDAKTNNTHSQTNSPIVDLYQVGKSENLNIRSYKDEKFYSGLNPNDEMKDSKNLNLVVKSNDVLEKNEIIKEYSSLCDFAFYTNGRSYSWLNELHEFSNDAWLEYIRDIQENYESTEKEEAHYTIQPDEEKTGKEIEYLHLYTSKQFPEKARLMDLLYCHQKPKLIVLDLNGLLMYRWNVTQQSQKCIYPPILESSRICNVRPANSRQNFDLFVRPGAQKFLGWCLSHFAVGIWSSMKKENIEAMLKYILPEQANQLTFVWDQKYCTLGSKNGNLLSEEEKAKIAKGKPLMFKELKMIWQHPGFKNFFNPQNTLLIDDSVYKARLNPPNTAIHPREWGGAGNWYGLQKDERSDSLIDEMISSKGILTQYLQDLFYADDVPNFVDKKPFIYEDHQCDRTNVINNDNSDSEVEDREGESQGYIDNCFQSDVDPSVDKNKIAPNLKMNDFLHPTSSFSLDDLLKELPGKSDQEKKQNNNANPNFQLLNNNTKNTTPEEYPRNSSYLSPEDNSQTNEKKNDLLSDLLSQL